MRYRLEAARGVSVTATTASGGPALIAVLPAVRGQLERQRAL
jgi:hypothetical protein